MSEWMDYSGGTLDGTHWDHRDKDWKLGAVQYDWKCEDDVWHVDLNRYMVLEIYYDVKDAKLPDYADPVEETRFLYMLSVDVVQNHIWPSL
jgi:hypothetical protein